MLPAIEVAVIQPPLFPEAAVITAASAAAPVAEEQPQQPVTAAAAPSEAVPALEAPPAAAASEYVQEIVPPVPAAPRETVRETTPVTLQLDWSSGLTQIETDPEKHKAALIRAQEQPVAPRVKRIRRPLPSLSDEPLMQVETRKTASAIMTQGAAGSEQSPTAAAG